MAAAGKWDDLPSGGGIYGIWSPDRKLLYVGATGNLAARVMAHRVTEWLGCHIEIGLHLPGASRSERNRVEDRIILALRARGVGVANKTNSENHALYLTLPHARYREIAALGLGKQTRAERAANGLKGALALTKAQRQEARSKLPREAALLGTARGLHAQTTEQRRANGRKGAAIRWRKEA